MAYQGSHQDVQAAKVSFEIDLQGSQIMAFGHSEHAPRWHVFGTTHWLSCGVGTRGSTIRFAFKRTLCASSARRRDSVLVVPM